MRRGNHAWSANPDYKSFKDAQEELGAEGAPPELEEWVPPLAHSVRELCDVIDGLKKELRELREKLEPGA